MSRKVYPIQGNKTITNKNTLDLIPFTANNRKNLDVVRVSRDGTMTVEYKALTPITDFEAKTSLSLFKMCLDANAHEGENAVKEIKDHGAFVKVKFDVRGLTKFITSRTTREQRVKVFKSLKKIAGMQVDITKKRSVLEGGGEMRSITSWVNDLKTKDDYETATVWVSKTALRVAMSDGISYDLRFAVQQFTGRAMLLYLHLQSWKYKIRDGRYGYQNYIPHENIAQALDLGELVSEKDRMKKARAAFKELAAQKVCNYEYDGANNRWVKKLLGL